MSRGKSKVDSKGNSRGNSCATFIGAVLVSFALAYFLLPVLQPTTEPTGLIRQTKIVESHSDAINLGFSASTPIPDMTLELTIAAQSSLQAMLSSGITLLLHDDGLGTQFSGSIYFDISLVVQGVGNRTIDIGYYSSVKINASVAFIQTFYLEYRTGSLAAGTYDVTAYWCFRTGTTFTGLAQLSMTAGVGNKNYSRMLTVQEITG
jgi:hypothetical protein